MHVRSRFATAIAATAMLTVGAMSAATTPALADGGTTATFALTGGSLAITVPASTVALNTGTVNTGAASASAQLGSVTVADTRGALVNSWTATVSSTAFTTGTATTNETVAVNQIAYSSGAFTAHSGLGVFVPGLLVNGTLPGTAGSYTGAAGNSSTAWNPTLTFTLLSSQVAGTYTGTVTHSVA